MGGECDREKWELTGLDNIAFMNPQILFRHPRYSCIRKYTAKIAKYRHSLRGLECT